MKRHLIIKSSKPECIWNSKLYLGEGVLWVPSLNSILLVDIEKKSFLMFNTKTKIKKIFKIDKQIGFISHFDKNIFILGLKSEIRFVNIDLNIGIISIDVENKKTNNRINDGKVDPFGRLWFGTMNYVKNEENGSLYCLTNNLILNKVDKKYFITNGPAFLSKNNFYHSDSKKRLIYKIKINNKFKILKKHVFIKFSKSDGYPDGMTTDTKNNLWVCHYAGKCITVYNTKGIRIHKIIFPAKNITNCTFGGKKNNELFVSTARKGMTKNELKKYPLSGALFKVKVNLKGKKTNSFKIL
jgi:sugar lactone lactonase YvrE